MHEDIAPQRKPTVLVVDDDPVARQLLKAQLEAAGHPVLMAASGPEALALLHQHRPSMVILDWVMPNMDGLQVCRAIRQIHAAPLVYVIMLTVHDDTSQLIEAFDAGVDDFLTKPFDAGELMARLRAGRRILHLHQKLLRKVRLTRKLNRTLANLNGTLRTLATIDELTGVLNRREGMNRLHAAWDLAERYGQPISCWMLDVNDFKQINDAHGHHEGDRALQRMGRALVSACRSCDIVFRYGGDEFVIVLPNTPSANAHEVLQRCRTAMDEIRGGGPGPLTFSAGVGERGGAVTSAELLLQHADAALYAAKHKDRPQDAA